MTRKSVAAMILLLAATLPLEAQDQTVGLFYNLDGSFNGYTLFAPLSYNITYLIDHDGLLVNSWESEYTPGNATYLLNDGTLLRSASLGIHPIFQSGGSGGGMQLFDWDGSLLWDFRYSDQSVLSHHDMEALPNGNILMIAWEYKSAAEAIAAGRAPQLLPEGELWPDHIIEVQPTGPTTADIVWQWHVWDHLAQDLDPSKENYGIVEGHPELININFVEGHGPGAGHPDWNHTNGIDYNGEFDQILVSVRAFSEIWVIDHSTTIEEAAGHTGGNSGKGGDILYRWGNPEAYGAGDESDQEFFGQHDAQWIDSGHPGEGNILVFNNGAGRPEGDYSSVEEIIPPVDVYGNYQYTPGSQYGPDEQEWIYAAADPEDFYSGIISGAQRLPNGNTLICSGNQGTFFEVTPGAETLWLYVNPVTEQGPLYQGDPIPLNPSGQGTLNMVFKVRRYAPDFEGFQGHDLIPGDPVELYPSGTDDPFGQAPEEISLSPNYPNPFCPNTIIGYSLSTPTEVRLTVYTLLGQEVKLLYFGSKPAGYHRVVWDGTNSWGETTSAGVYVYTLQTGQKAATRKMILMR